MPWLGGKIKNPGAGAPPGEKKGADIDAGQKKEEFAGDNRRGTEMALDSWIALDGQSQRDEKRIWPVVWVEADPNGAAAAAFVLENEPIEDGECKIYAARTLAEGMRIAKLTRAAALFFTEEEAGDEDAKAFKAFREGAGWGMRAIARTSGTSTRSGSRFGMVSDMIPRGELTRSRLLACAAQSVKACREIEELESRKSVLDKALSNLERLAVDPGSPELLHDMLKDLEAGAGLPLWLIVAENGLCKLHKTESALPISVKESDLPNVLAAAGLRTEALQPIDTARGGILPMIAYPKGTWLDIKGALLKPGLRALRGALAGAARERDERESALTDSATGVWSRTGFALSLKDLVDQQNESIGVYLVDLAGFGKINAALGHEVGDEILRESAKRLRGYAGSFPVGRITSDAFAIAMPAQAWNAQALDELFALPVHTANLPLTLQVRVGAVPAKKGENAGVWLTRCASALDEAKRAGKSGAAPQWFDAKQESMAMERLELSQKLVQALKMSGQLYMAYQPQICLRTKKVIGAESLLRWRLPDGTFISPDKFIPIAEQAGLAGKISDFALSESVGLMGELDEAGLGLPAVAVNISAAEIEDLDFCQKVLRLMSGSKVAHGRIEIELTETAAAKNPDAILGTLAKLRQLGFKTALDDFGSGYSSLGRLASFPLDKIKIDKVFTQALGAEGQMAKIAGVISQIGKALGITVLAEGVENPGQEAELRKLGIDSAQGWLYAKALAKEQLIEFLKDWPFGLA